MILTMIHGKSNVIFTLFLLVISDGGVAGRVHIPLGRQKQLHCVAAWIYYLQMYFKI